jgi:hypothetical protein
MMPSYFLIQAPEGGAKTRLGGEPRRDEQVLSRTGMCMDPVETVDDLSEENFRMPFPPSSGTTEVAKHHRSGRSASTSTS